MMLVFDSPFVEIKEKTAAALGFFDGVHKGHQKIIRSAVEYGRKNGIPSVVWTFHRSPKNTHLFSVPVITDFNERKALFEGMGVDILIAFPFLEEVKRLKEYEFVNTVLKNCLNAEKVFCGFNYSFGAGGKGTPQDLFRLSKEQGISVEILPEISVDGETVSSTRIREYIENGLPEKAQKLLGRPYSISGIVSDGSKLGRTLGFPTANIKIGENKVVPADGVYLTLTNVEGMSRFGITNIGVKPTVDGTFRGAENFIFDFDDNIYGKEIKIQFLKFIRKETKFPSVQALSEQVKKDIKEAKSHIK